MLKIPFSLLPYKTLRKISYLINGIGQKVSTIFPHLKLNLKQLDSKLTPKEYVSMCIIATILFFIFISILLSVVLTIIKIESSILISLTISFFISIFIFFQQIAYPKLLLNRKIRNIDRNLLPTLQDLLVQLNSGIPLFDIFVNLSKSDYGQLSKEFEKAVKEINAGRPQIEALEEIATNNPSIFLRRSIWQLVNGMKAGSDMSSIIKEIIKSLSDEQLIQIQNYGGQLNPLTMFYMLIAVILPALAITFITVISSFISASEYLTKIIFYSLFVLIVFFQIMFLGMIKTRRPNLLST